MSLKSHLTGSRFKLRGGFSFCWVTLLGAIFLLGGNVSGETAATYRHALIIGISTYRDDDVPRLYGVPNDMDSAREIAAAMGIPRSNITELFNESATKQKIVRELQRLARDSKNGSRILVYFSGHGTRWKDASAGGCVEGLLTWDRRAIVNSEFAKLANPIGQKAENVIIMFDACHSGGVYGQTRSVKIGQSAGLTPKFFLRADAAGRECREASNLRRRSLLTADSGALDSLPENVVRIMSAREDEVSFDEPSRGGLATQAIRRCMLGDAIDADGSGAITLQEIQACAQEVIAAKVAKFPDLLPHHISVTGFRNLVPVAVNPASQSSGQAEVSSTQTPSAESIREEKQRLARERQEAADKKKQQELAQAAQRAERLRLERAKLEEERIQAERERERLQRERAESEKQRLANERAEAARREQARLSQIAAQTVASEAMMIGASTDTIALGPAASFENLFSQRDIRRAVNLKLSGDILRINRDSLSFVVTSSHPGYVYVFLLGSDETSFYTLFPNSLDSDNRIDAKSPMRLPRPNWGVMAAGPPGTDQLLVIVTETPRRIDALLTGEKKQDGPILWTPATIEGRRKIVDFVLGSGVSGSARYWAARTNVREVQ